jgi:hypothetical protein
MAAANGGDAMPVLDPAISTPTARTHAEGAKATMVIPSVATIPAPVATNRGPRRLVTAALAMIAAQ